MNNENEKVVNLPVREMFLNEVLGKTIIQKMVSKKWLIARRTFFFLVGFVFYLIYS